MSAAVSVPPVADVDTRLLRWRKLVRSLRRCKRLLRGGCRRTGVAIVFACCVLDTALVAAFVTLSQSPTR